MRTRSEIIAFCLAAFIFPALNLSAQQDRKAVELANLEKGVATAKARVELNQKQLAAADSLIDLGFSLVRDGKAELKAVDSESKILEKEYATKHKPLSKLAASKDKAEAARAKTDLRTLDTQYRSDNKALEIRMREAERKQISGTTTINRGRTAKMNAQDALKVSNSALKVAQQKYDAAAGK